MSFPLIFTFVPSIKKKKKNTLVIVHLNGPKSLTKLRSFRDNRPCPYSDINPMKYLLPKLKQCTLMANIVVVNNGLILDSELDGSAVLLLSN